MIHKLYDFRGGYATDLTPEQMDGNMLLEGQNVHYKGKLKKRPSWENLSTDATINTAGNIVRGMVRAYFNGGWTNIVAIDDTSDVNFYHGDSGSYTSIDSSYDWTTGKDVEMVFFNDIVIAVNGTDKPAVISYSGGYSVQNLETYDVRTRGADEWYAGQWDDSETPTFVDDTTDAQDAGANDFAIATATNNDGFYVAGVNPFTKVILYGATDLGSSADAEITYYAGSGTWTALTVTTEPAWNSAEADKTLEFTLPLASDGTLAWEKYGDVSTQVDPTGVPGGALNRYILRVRFTTADSAGTCDYLEVYHTQYLNQIFLNDKPNAVAIHQNRVFLAAGNAFRFSPPNTAKGWDSRDIEYCQDGGRKILQMVSGAGQLVILKEAAVYRFIGTTTDNFTLRTTVAPGAQSARGAASISGVVCYVSSDGIRAVVDDKSLVVSRHIQSDIDSWTKTDAVMISWDGDMLLSFPTNSIILWADPDTLRQDDMGDGRLSFWEWTGLKAIQMLFASGSGDDGLIFAVDSTNRRIVKSGTNGYDTAFNGSTQTAITTTIQTKYESFGVPGQKKCIKRVRPEVSKSGDWTATFYSNDAQNSATATISSGTGTGHYLGDISPPYTLDGYNFSTKLVNATTNTVEVYGISTEIERRAF